MQNKALMKILCDTPAIAGREGKMRSVLRKETSEFVDEMFEDGLGSLIVHKKGKGPKILIAAHMDEVGFLVKFVTPEGMLVVIPIGAVRPLSMIMQDVVVTTSHDNIIHGTIHTNDVNQQIYVDLGLDSAEEVWKLKIDIGDMVTYATAYRDLTDRRYRAKALDNRCGCYVLIELLKKIVKNDANLYGSFTSSEEVGLRGAKTAAELVKPDYAIVIDVACARNEFVRDYTNNRQIGKGPMLLFYDKTMMPNRELLTLAKQKAEEYTIPIQKDLFANGGTDGGSIHLANFGIPTIVIGIPNRYGHGPYAFGDYGDMEYAVTLLKKMVEDLAEREGVHGFQPRTE